VKKSVKKRLTLIGNGGRDGSLSKIVIFLVRLYKKIPHRRLCKFEPSCSTYMILALEKYGGLKGFFKGIARILRCNPFSEGGEDYP
jgi:uncharacterized protein